MPIDLSPLSAAQTTALGLSNLILATPQEKLGYEPQGRSDEAGAITTKLPRFLFHYEGEQEVSLESDITDHYAEDNTTFQDQIALKPEIVNTNGFIGELNNVTPPALEPAREAVDRLTAIAAFQPGLSVTAQLAYNAAFQAYQAATNIANAAVNAWKNITGAEGTQTEQAAAFQQFYGYWADRTLFTVQTPWGVFEDMAIQVVRAIQDGETESFSTFEISFKKMRFSDTFQVGSGIQSSALDAKYMEGRAGAQGFGEVDLGTSTPTPDIPLTDNLSALA